MTVADLTQVPTNSLMQEVKHREDFWSIMGSCNIYAQVGVILCWYHDEDNVPWTVNNDGLKPGDEDYLSDIELKQMQKSVDKDVKQARKYLAQLVELVPDIVDCNFAKMNQGILFDIYDALGSFPDRNENLDVIYCAVKEAWSQSIRKTA